MRSSCSLSDLFAVSLYGYAVMSNHYHIVLETHPGTAEDWTDKDVADRWMRLFPGSVEDRERRHSLLLQDKPRLAMLQERLCSLSWSMRCLNEPIARMANREDQSKGRSWEGRFQSQQILDEAGLLAAMIYVDLNPIRAGTADSLETSQYTSVSRRISTTMQDDQVRAMNRTEEPMHLNFRLADYLELARFTALEQLSQRPISERAQQLLSQVNTSNFQKFLLEILPIPHHWQRALGSPPSIEICARSIGQRRIKTYCRALSS